MSLYPAVQTAAQRELDRVVGSDRLPDISDRAQLPYIDALCKEVVRWHVAAPLGMYCSYLGSSLLTMIIVGWLRTAVPHRTREDYVYERGGGMEPLLIPKDSLVIPNLWSVCRVSAFTAPLKMGFAGKWHTTPRVTPTPWPSTRAGSSRTGRGMVEKPSRTRRISVLDMVGGTSLHSIAPKPWFIHRPLHVAFAQVQGGSTRFQSIYEFDFRATPGRNSHLSRMQRRPVGIQHLQGAQREGHDYRARTGADVGYCQVLFELCSLHLLLTMLTPPQSRPTFQMCRAAPERAGLGAYSGQLKLKLKWSYL